jgi:hypothetical protein
MKKKPKEKNENAGSLKYLRSRIGPGRRGGRRDFKTKLQKIRIGSEMNATIRTDHANPRDGLFMI